MSGFIEWCAQRTLDQCPEKNKLDFFGNIKNHFAVMISQVHLDFDYLLMTYAMDKGEPVFLPNVLETQKAIFEHIRDVLAKDEIAALPP